MSELSKLYRMADHTAKTMKQRLRQKYEQGYKGWEWDDGTIRWRLGLSLRKKKWIDVCNLAAMLYGIQVKVKK